MQNIHHDVTDECSKSAPGRETEYEYSKRGRKGWLLAGPTLPFPLFSILFSLLVLFNLCLFVFQSLSPISFRPIQMSSLINLTGCVYFAPDAPSARNSLCTSSPPLLVVREMPLIRHALALVERALSPTLPSSTLIQDEGKAGAAALATSPEFSPCLWRGDWWGSWI